MHQIMHNAPFTIMSPSPEGIKQGLNATDPES
jgi:hypothetical protein